MDPSSSQLANRVWLSTKVETLRQELLLLVCLERTFMSGQRFMEYWLTHRATISLPGSRSVYHLYQLGLEKVNRDRGKNIR